MEGIGMTQLQSKSQLESGKVIVMPIYLANVKKNKMWNKLKTCAPRASTWSSNPTCFGHQDQMPVGSHFDSIND